MNIYPQRAETSVRRVRIAKGCGMTDRNPPALDDIFRTLDRWRHLPAYRLEPTLAPFFGLFLRDVLSEVYCIGDELHPTIIPEFPLPIKGEKSLSNKVDYAAFSCSQKKVYFVELKTDSGSIREEQIKYLKSAKGRNFQCLLKDILKISKASRGIYIQKHAHLLHLLRDVYLVDYNDGNLYEIAFRKRRQGWKDCIERIEQHVDNENGKYKKVDIQIVYITPTGNTELLRKTGFCEIGFDCVADIVAALGGFGPMFAYYLKRWKSQAGEIDPRKIHTWK